MVTQECQSTYSTIAFFRMLQRLWRYMRYLSERCGEWNEMKRQHRELLGLEDRMLRDIGLSRADAVRITKGHSFWKYLFQPEAYVKENAFKARTRSDL